ncbi:MAG: FecR domain-containing protein [Pseudomonadota bacterium]
MKTGSDLPQTHPHAQDAIDERAQDWFLLLNSGEANGNDRVGFNEWLQENPLHGQAFKECAALWEDIDGLKEAFELLESDEVVSHDHVDHSLKSQNVKVLKQQPTTTRFFWGGALAACFALMVFNLTSLSTIWRADYRTTVGEQAQVTLPDGSTAWLNTNTAIDVDYKDGRREITLLKGEAEFDVQKNPDSLFVIHANGGQAAALGTIYSVRKRDNRVDVRVSEGAVEVIAPRLSSTQRLPNPALQGRVIVREGQQTHYTRNKPPIEPEKMRYGLIPAWRKGFIAIHNQSIADALTEIDRYHPGRIVLLADTQELKPVTARLAINSLLDGLEALAATQGLKVIRITDYLVLVQ